MESCGMLYLGCGILAGLDWGVGLYYARFQLLLSGFLISKICDWPLSYGLLLCLLLSSPIAQYLIQARGADLYLGVVYFIVMLCLTIH